MTKSIADSAHIGTAVQHMARRLLAVGVPLEELATNRDICRETARAVFESVVPMMLCAVPAYEDVIARCHGLDPETTGVGMDVFHAWLYELDQEIVRKQMQQAFSKKPQGFGA